MSFNIHIGEAVVDKHYAEEEADEYGTELKVAVHSLELEGAPVFRGDSMTGNSNSRYPGYLQWDEAVRAMTLHDLFFKKDTGIMSQHPGCFLLTKKHANKIRRALNFYKVNHPDAKPGWCDCDECAKPIKGDGLPHEDLDGVLARLIWLDFWVHWALENCKIPAIYNS